MFNALLEGKLYAFKVCEELWLTFYVANLNTASSKEDYELPGKTNCLEIWHTSS